MTFEQAIAQLPQTAKWSSSFGYPGCDRYSEIHRDPQGNRWEIAQAHVDAGWTIRKI
jgi:predicted glycosyl hydrolase (DUF1957 family)